MSNIQNNIEGLVPTVQALSLQTIQLTGLIAQKESELKNLPDVIRLEKEIFDLMVEKRKLENKESESEGCCSCESENADTENPAPNM